MRLLLPAPPRNNGSSLWYVVGLVLFLLAAGSTTLVLLSASRQPPVLFPGETRQAALPGTHLAADGLVYTNQRLPRVPWSVHLVRWPRRDPSFVLYSQHADNAALGLATLSSQLRIIDPALGKPVAAVNGDFYQRDRAYAGDSRGLQIIESEVISAPIGGTSLWIDAQGQPHIDDVQSRFRVRWSSGAETPFALNESRGADECVLFTGRIGDSTRADRGREIILDPVPGSRWTPIQIGRSYSARIREIRDNGDSPVDAQTLVLSLGPSLIRRVPRLAPGDSLELILETTPDLTGARTAISGGPTLVRGGKAQRIRIPDSEGYQFRSMGERHPRTAVGWNDEHFFFVQVDGRQRGLSVGMTLDELGRHMADLGIREAMNLDGGGSSMLWCHGAIRNSPCDGRERAIANSLVVLRAPTPGGGSPSTTEAARE